MQALTSPEDLLKVLTNDATKSYLGSVTLMKQLTVATVSTIVYFKEAFPEDSYNIEKFRELQLRILKKNCRDESAQFLSTALINAFDAFDKKYLHRLVLSFYDDECRPDNLVDYHIFEYSYHESGAGMSVRSGRDGGSTPEPRGLDHSAYALLQSCTVLNHGFQNKMPPSFDISLRLYYNEAAPEDYQAPGFRCGDEFEELSHAGMFPNMLGDIHTPYHGMRLTSWFNENLCSSNEAIASQNPPLLTQTQDVLAFPSSARCAGSAGSAGALRCPCGIDRADLPPDLTSLITCDYCKTQQHAVCFGLLRGGGGGGGGHCCAVCADEDHTRTPTCLHLAKQDNKNRLVRCVARLVLAWCAARSVASEASLTALGLAPAAVRKVLHYLRTKDVLAHDHWDVPQKVNEVQLRKVIKVYFSDAEEADDAGVVERLLQETRASQESRPDSAADSLSPAQKWCVEGAGLLQQYRAALTPTPTELAPRPPCKRALHTHTLTYKLTTKRSRTKFQ